MTEKEANDLRKMMEDLEQTEIVDDNISELRSMTVDMSAMLEEDQSK